MTTTIERADPVEKFNEKRRALGRGLDSLLPAGPRPMPAAMPPAVASDPGYTPETGKSRLEEVAAPGVAVLQIPLDRIDANPFQTRKVFAPAALEELAESIRTTGVVQPIVVRPTAQGRYVLVLGERRCRASQLAGKETIAAIVRTVSDQQAAEMTIVENLQRQDLNCLEQAHGFVRLSRDFGLTQDQIGQRTGISRESVSNYMRLLKLPTEVHKLLEEGSLGFSEARLLLQLSDSDLIRRAANEAVEKKMSVARLKEYVDELSLAIHDSTKTGQASWVDPNVREAQSQLERILGVRVRIADRKGKGKIVIEYASIDDFERVVEVLSGKSK